VTPAAKPASGPPPAGDSRANVTGRRHHVRPDDHGLGGVRDRGEACSSSVRPGARARPCRCHPVVAPGLRSGSPRPMSRLHRGAWWQSGAMQVVLVQEASTPNRRTTAAGWRRWCRRRRPGRPARGVRPGLRRTGSDLTPYAEAVDGAFAAEVERVAALRGATWLRGCSSRPRTRRTTPWSCAAAPTSTTARSTSTTRSATASPTCWRPARSHPRRSISTGRQSA
jgi:hypothetical protein